MTRSWHDHLKDARDRLLSGGAEVQPSDIVAAALAQPGGQEAFELAGADLARAKSLRNASSLLRDAADIEGADETVARLFDDLPYRAPRALTLTYEGGRITHRGIEHATRADFPQHDRTLRLNIERALERRTGWELFKREVDPWLRSESATVLDALRARDEQRRAA